MQPLKEVELFADYVEHAREQASAGTELTRAMIARSREQIELSRNLLKIEPPKVWHPRPK